ncbi:MAG: hypothetical protein H5T46_00325 [Archaeoglobi archaeon]|nr:hypothetical protein [Candidatus Mnemosynella sp.]
MRTDVSILIFLAVFFLLLAGYAYVQNWGLPRVSGSLMIAIGLFLEAYRRDSMEREE